LANTLFKYSLMLCTFYNIFQLFKMYQINIDTKICNAHSIKSSANRIKKYLMFDIFEYASINWFVIVSQSNYYNKKFNKDELW
jgi:hypothetical protein